MVKIVLVVSVCVLVLWLYCCYKWDIAEKREKEAIEQALEDAGYVQRPRQAEGG